MKTSFKITLGAAVVAVTMFAGSAFSQSEDARIPFIVNADATVIASRGSDTARITVESGVENTLTIPAEKLVSVRHGVANRQTNAARLRLDSRGNLNLNLPQNNYHNATFSLYSLNGRRVMHTNINETTRNFSRSNFASGVYMLSVKGINGNSFTTRFNHRGGAMNVNISYDEILNSDLRRETVAFLTSAEDEWDIRVTAAGYVDSVYTLAIVGGVNARQEITLREESDGGEWIIIEDYFTDERDGQEYRMVFMPDGKWWMAENLNYKNPNWPKNDVTVMGEMNVGDKGSWCYGNNADNCETYGRLYTWNAALEACPTGWHLPMDVEWAALVTVVENGSANTAAKHLKALDGWAGGRCGPNGSGKDYSCEDTYGFSALPGGLRNEGGAFGNPSNGYWWTATEQGSSSALLRYIYSSNERVFQSNFLKSEAFSVRCVRD